jgi:hypothetical protein
MDDARACMLGDVCSTLRYACVLMVVYMLREIREGREW